MKRRLVLVRHGQTEYNKSGRMQGQLDTALSAVGIAEAKSVASQIGEWNVSAVYSSDLERAVDTAKILADAWGLDVITDRRLRETDLGDWTGASHEEVDRDYPGQRAYWRHAPTWAPPNAETRVDVATRAHSLVNELMETDVFDRGMVVMVAHGGTIGALTAQLLELPISHFGMFSGLGNVRWSQLMARQKFYGDDGKMSRPAIDGSTVPRVPKKNDEWWKDPHWHLEGWNMSAAPGKAPEQTASPDEGGEDTPA